MKAKKPTKKIATKKLQLPNDEPLKLDMSFEQFVNKALNTPLKHSKINKK